MSLNFEEREAIVTYRLEKSQKTIEQVNFNLPGKYWSLIANRLYYAAYYAISALLISKGYSSRTHDTTVRLFGLHFVKTGLCSVEQGKLYNKLLSLRMTGDYNDHYDLDESDVLPLVDSTINLINDVSALAWKNIKEQKEG